MAKPTEKMLYGTCLDLHYAVSLNKQMVEEYTEVLKDAKKNLKKSEKLLEIAKTNYKELNGSEPKLTE